MSEIAIRIIPAQTAADLAAAASLFRAYAASLPISLDYQDFEAELAELPGKYAPPRGALFLARNSAGAALGCVALRPFDGSEVCEMKRLYVAPGGRGLGLGRALAEVIIAEAARLGYREMRLDTLPSMTAAVSLYGSVGFQPIAAYYDTPIAGTLFFSKKL